jgi:hypothetical protein
VSVAGLVRQLQLTLDDSEMAVGLSIAGKINTFGKDDVRFQVHLGHTGRYVV